MDDNRILTQEEEEGHPLAFFFGLRNALLIELAAGVVITLVWVLLIALSGNPW